MYLLRSLQFAKYFQCEYDCRMKDFQPENFPIYDPLRARPAIIDFDLEPIVVKKKVYDENAAFTQQCISRPLDHHEQCHFLLSFGFFCPFHYI